MDNRIQHQADELAKAIEESIDHERTSARLDVFTIIRDGVDKGITPSDILIKLLNWAGGTWER